MVRRSTQYRPRSWRWPALATAIVLWLTAATVAHAMPDLVLSEILCDPADPVDGEGVTIYLTVTNQGDETVTTDFWVPVWVEESFIGSLKVTQDLDPAEPTTYGSLTIGWTAAPSDHSISAKADGGHTDIWGNWVDVDLVAEADETNNELEVILSVPWPDLIVSDIAMSPPAPVDGQSTTIYLTVRNQGPGGLVRNFWVPTWVDEDCIGWVQVSQDLDPGESTTYGSLTIGWTAIPGDHSVYATADGGHKDVWGNWVNVDLVMESDETNNGLSVPLAVAWPDLVVTGISLDPADPDDGEVVTIYPTVRNQGAGGVVRNFWVPVSVDENYVASVNVVQDLDPGESTTYGSLHCTWTATPGDHSLSATADGGHKDVWGNWVNVDLVMESDEFNNVFSRDLGSSWSDLVVTALASDPPNPEPGQPVTFTATIRNAGDGATTRDFWVPILIDGGYHDSKKITKDLLPGFDDTIAFNPWTAAEGSHEVCVEADGGHKDIWGNWVNVNLVAESDEANNEHCLSVFWPQIGVEPTSLSFVVGERGGPAAETDAVATIWASRLLTVQNVGTGALHVEDIVGLPSGWLLAAPTSFLVLPGESRSVTVYADTSAPAGGTLEIHSDDPLTPMVVVPVAVEAQTWFEDDDPAVDYTGPWQPYTNPACSDGHLKYSNTPGSWCTLDFYGTGITWSTATGPMMGQARVYLDGGYAAQVDLYRPALGLTPLGRTGLASGWHTLAIVVGPEKNPSSTDYIVAVDAFEVLP